MSDEEMKNQEAAAASSEETTKAEPESASPEKEDTPGSDPQAAETAAEDTLEEKSGDAAPEEKAEEKAKEEKEDSNEKYMRLMADFQNYKRRTEKEKAEVFSYANEKIVTELLTVLDNFERALSQECADEKYAEGMQLIFKQMHDVLEKSGLQEIDAVGKEFDPNYHHAVMTDDNDQFESGQVTTVLQKGYTLHDKVIRPAMVRVNN